VRESQIDITLPAGVYYVVLDSIDYTAGGALRFSCGRVSLALRIEAG
jgi:hypothetical protein